MTTPEFLTQITDLYGDFATTGMARAVANKLQQLSDRQRDRLFDVYIKTIPGNFKPDLKAVIECIEKAGIKQENQRTCEACSYAWSSTSHDCPRCGYTKEDGDPVAYYHEWSEGYGRFNRMAIDEMLRNMRNGKSVMAN